MTLQCTSNFQSIKRRGTNGPCVNCHKCLTVLHVYHMTVMVSLSLYGAPLWLVARLVQGFDEREQRTGPCPLQHKDDFACLAGSPVPEVSWFRDGQVISTSTLPGVQISFSDGRARLMIPAVTKANSGRYSLRATNGSGQATSTAELLVTG
jgi:hypothetical protein